MVCVKNNKGFTLIELMLVISLIALLSGLSISVYSSTQTKNDLNIAVSTFVNDARNAQIKARLSNQDDAWGVKIEQSQIILFKGNNFSSRDQSYDQISKISPNITYSGLSDFSFAKVTGLPVVPGSVTLSNVSGQNLTINISSNGVINY